MLHQIKQDFIYGFSLPKNKMVDVKELCAKNGLDYLCAGDYEGEGGPVIGVKLDLKNVIGDTVLGQGKRQLFSMEGFLMAYHAAREKLNSERVRHLKDCFDIPCESEICPNLWTVSCKE